MYYIEKRQKVLKTLTLEQLNAYLQLDYLQYLRRRKELPVLVKWDDCRGQLFTENGMSYLKILADFTILLAAFGPLIYIFNALLTGQ